jgi:hypothetical protein
LRTFLKRLGIISIGLWTLLSAIVIYFVIDRQRNPGLKGISNVDLVHYRNISVALIFVFILTRLIKKEKTK